MSLAQFLRSASFGLGRQAAAYLESRFAALEAGSTGLQLASTAPADVTKAAASVGNGTTAARANHKHDVSTAAAGGLTSASTSAEGSATSLARSDHAHAITALDGRSMVAIADKAAGALAGADFGPTLELLLTIPAGDTGAVDFTGLPFKVRVLGVEARKVTTSADAGDTGQLTTSGDVAISSVLALNITEGVLAKTTSINAAAHEIAAAGTLRWARTQSTNAACVVRVTCVRVS